jgi:hypothetical protein
MYKDLKLLVEFGAEQSRADTVTVQMRNAQVEDMQA